MNEEEFIYKMANVCQTYTKSIPNSYFELGLIKPENHYLYFKDFNGDYYALDTTEKVLIARSSHLMGHRTLSLINEYFKQSESNGEVNEPVVPRLSITEAVVKSIRDSTFTEDELKQKYTKAFKKCIENESASPKNNSFDKRVKSITTDVAQTVIMKNHDYGDSYAKSIEKYGQNVFLIRIDDKLNRYQSLLKNEAEVNDESIIDTLKDIAGYATLEIERRMRND